MGTQVQRLQQELESCNHELASLKQEYAAYKKHSTELLNKVIQSFSLATDQF